MMNVVSSTENPQKQAMSSQELAEKAQPGPFTGIIWACFAAIGVYASISLVLDEIAHYADPKAQLSCNINALFGCSSSLTSWQAHLLFGIPNSALGTMAFSMMLAWALLVVFKVRFPALVWQGLSLAFTAAGFLVAWFLYQSLTEFRALCPFCMLTWLATLVLGAQIIFTAAGLGVLPGPLSVRKVLYQERWLLTILLVVLVAAIVAIGLWDVLLVVLG